MKGALQQETASDGASTSRLTRPLTSTTSHPLSIMATFYLVLVG